MSQKDPKITFLNTHEVAQILRKKERTIREWCYSKQIPHYKVGKKRLFIKDEILSWVLDECRIQMESGKVNLVRTKNNSHNDHPPKLNIRTTKNTY